MPKGELSWLGGVWGRLHLELGPAVPLPSFHPFLLGLVFVGTREILKESRLRENIK